MFIKCSILDVGKGSVCLCMNNLVYLHAHRKIQESTWIKNRIHAKVLTLMITSRNSNFIRRNMTWDLTWESLEDSNNVIPFSWMQTFIKQSCTVSHILYFVAVICVIKDYITTTVRLFLDGYKVVKRKRILALFNLTDHNHQRIFFTDKKN